MAKNTKWAVSMIWQWIVACTKWAYLFGWECRCWHSLWASGQPQKLHWTLRVLCLFVVPIIQYLCIVPSALFGAVQSMCKCLTTNRFRTVLDLLPVHGTHASTITLLYMYTILVLPCTCTWYTCFNYWLGIVVLFACCIISLVISSACLSVLLACVLTTLNWQLEHTWQS